MNMAAGDIVFCHGTGVISKAIRFGEWIRWRGGDHWNHIAILDRQVDGVWFVIQAEGKGVTNDKTLSSLGDYKVVSCPPDAHPGDVLLFARAQVGTKYGWLSIASIVVDILTPERLCLRKSGTFICSALAATSLLFAGCELVIPFGRSDLYQTSPAALWLALTKEQP